MTLYRTWLWFAGCRSVDVSGTLWTIFLPGTKNKATIEAFADHLGEGRAWESTTYCSSKRLVSRSRFKKNAPGRGRFSFVGPDAPMGRQQAFEARGVVSATTMHRQLPP